MPEMRPMSGMGSGTAATLIAYGVRVEGDFSSQGDVSIEGEVHGSVKITGRLSVGSQALLKADVSADQATVAGTIEGNLSVGGHLQLTSTAKVMGDIACETASVESGATLNGKVMIGAKPPMASKAPKANEAKSA